VDRPAAAAAAGQAENAIRPIFGVCRKAAGVLVKCPLAVVAGAAFFDDMALHDNDVVFVFQVYHISVFL